MAGVQSMTKFRAVIDGPEQAESNNPASGSPPLPLAGLGLHPPDNAQDRLDDAYYHECGFDPQGPPLNWRPGRRRR